MNQFIMRPTSILAAISGNIIEWYDFTLYIFLAPVLAQQFFPQQNQLNALMSIFLIFAMGFFVRPLGSIFFGHLGDRLGRSATLQISILVISISTLSIALLPSYSQWGIYSGLGLCGLRIIQGLCIGGEFAGSMIYLSEMSEEHCRARVSCMSNNGSNIGIFIATMVIALLSQLLAENTFSVYGWRLAFLLGGLAGLIALSLRRQLVESPVFMRLSEEKQIQALPLLTVLRSHKREVLRIFLLVAMAAAGSYALMDFMGTYLHQFLHYSLKESLKIQTLCNALTFGLVYLAAKLADHFGRRFMLLIAAWGFILFSIPCFYLLNLQGSWLWLLPLVVFYCFEEACTPAVMTEMFPVQARYTGISLGYNLAMALVGGLAPLINTWLFERYDNPLVIGYYLCLGAGLALVVIVGLPYGWGFKKQVVDFIVKP